MQAGLLSVNPNNAIMFDNMTIHPCNIAVFLGGWHAAYPGLLRKNYWRIPIKTGSSHGSETATAPETTHSPLAPNPARTSKTDCCMKG